MTVHNVVPELAHAPIAEPPVKPLGVPVERGDAEVKVPATGEKSFGKR